MDRKHTERKFVTCAGCVVYRTTPDGIEVLLIKPRQSVDAWGIPKGHMEEGESLIDCAIRETWEETGLACMPEKKLDPVDTINPHEYKRVHAFLARHMGDSRLEPITEEEVDEIKWWPLDDLPKIHRYQVSMMQQAVSLLTAMAL